jgi:hypothetical protein
VSARRRSARRALALLLAVIALSACGSTGATSVPQVAASPTIGPTHNEASPVKLTLLSPLSDEIVTGSTVHVKVSVSGGTITQAYSTQVSPTVGHIHLYLNSQLVSMAYATETELPVDPGAVYSLYAEWVAEDHGSFTPRDMTPKIYFSAASSASTTP